MTNSERDLTFRSLICVAAGILGLAVVAIGFTISALRSDAAQDTAREIGNTATVLAEQTSRTVQSIDIVLTELQERVYKLGVTTPDNFRRLTDNIDTYNLLIDRLARLPQAAAINLIDSTGSLWTTSRSWPRPKLKMTDREFFIEHQKSRGLGIFVASPVQSPVSGAWTVTFSRRMEGPNGEFLGIISIGAETSYFRNIYDSMRSLNEQSIVLQREEGSILLRYPNVESMVGKRLSPSSQWYDTVAKGGGHYWSQNANFDDKTRLIAVRPLRDYPLVVSVAITDQAAFANWRRRATFIAAGTLLILCCSIYLLTALTRQFRRLSRSEFSLVERERMLAQQANQLASANMQIDAALNNITHGLCMFDENASIVVVNDRYIKMYGLSRSVVKPGCTLRQLIEHRKEVGLFDGDPEKYCDDIIATIAQGKIASHSIETTDGRTIYAVQQPMPNGGWVVTHDDITERRRSEEHMAHMARHDALTGLANRMQLLEKMEEALARCRRRGEKFTVLMFDLDLFKAVNDSLGHPVGDALLKAVAQRLRSCTRETDTVARLGGDEFALVQLAQGNQRENAIILANKLLEVVSAPYEIDGHQIVIGTSIGIVLAPADGVQADALLKNADLALYRAKAEGRNGFRLFDLEMDAEARARHALQVDLRNAVAHEEFELHYQTVYSAETRQPVGAEALVRWRHPVRGMVQPGEFIAIAEEVGMIVPLGEWILRKACSDAVKWPEHIKVAVNLSPAQFRNCNLMEMVADALVESGLAPERLELEITESVLLQKSATNLTMLHQFKSLGISVVLDDFGTGYSSLSYLRMFPFDKIKIDRSFVSELSNRADCAAIVCAVTGLGRGLNILTTAEGVETEEQLDLLRAAGVDQLQGYLMARPKPLAEVDFMLARKNERAA
jgi:diguanylate cyclase (GGDEF)-like protein